MTSLNIGFRKLKGIVQNNKVLGYLYGYLHSCKANLIAKKLVNRLEQIESFSEKKLLHLQNRKLIEMLTYAFQNTDYYKNLFNQNDVDPKNIKDFNKIPFLTKEIIKANWSSMISGEYKLEHLGKKNTGGSTGQPLEFYCDTKAGLIDYGHHWYLYSLMGYKNGDVIIGCGGIRIAEDIKQKNIFWEKRKKGSVFGDYLFSVLYINDENIKVYLDKIIELKPDILRGYPSFYDSLAQFIIKNDIQLGFKIKGINLTAEMCSETQRKNIESAFDTMVYFEYGHSEVCLYCYTMDETYVYKSSPIYGYIEILNDDGTETKLKEVGNVVVTGFINKGMPFIRYKTGDLARIENRNGGIVKLSSIYGRSQDYILSKTNQKIFLTALIFGQHLKAFSNIVKWQIVQNQIGVIELFIEKGNNYSKNDEIDIIEKITTVADVEITFKYVNHISRTKRGKHLFLKQNIVD